MLSTNIVSIVVGAVLSLMPNDLSSCNTGNEWCHLDRIDNYAVSHHINMLRMFSQEEAAGNVAGEAAASEEAAGTDFFDDEGEEYDENFNLEEHKTQKPSDWNDEEDGEWLPPDEEQGEWDISCLSWKITRPTLQSF